jgi:uncharacterized protein YbcV (DUF1398 family)
MDDRSKQIAERCLRGAQDGSITFPQIVGKLIEGGFESYTVDYRTSRAIYYRPDGDSVELTTHRHAVAIAEAFDAVAVKAAIKEAQQLVPGYTYEGFCKKVMSAGCAGYIVSFSGRRALYFGRTAETHVEHFPQ